MAPMVQSFFAYRIRRFSDSYYVATFCWALSLLRIVGAIWLFTVLRKSPSTEYFYKYYSWLVTMVYATGALVDVVIAVSMCWYLARMRKLSVKETKSSINHLVTWCIRKSFFFLTTISSLTQPPPISSFQKLGFWRGEYRSFFYSTWFHFTFISIGSIATLVTVRPLSSTLLLSTHTNLSIVHINAEQSNLARYLRLPR